MGQDRAPPHTRPAVPERASRLISRGKPFVALAMLLAGWTVIRIVTLGQGPSQDIQRLPQIAAKQTAGSPPLAETEAQPSSYFPPTQIVRQHRIPAIAAIAVKGRSHPTPHRREQTAKPSDPPTPAVVSAKVWPAISLTPPMLVVRTDPAPHSNSVQPQPAQSRLSLYAYSYWRWPSGTATLAPAGQYGGSQSGLIAAYRIWSEARLDAQFRLAIAPQRNGEREAALGLRWQPFNALPLRIVAERRFRDKGPDRFAVAIAGGTNPLQLPAGFTLESYGQMGWADGPGGSWFFDASAQATRPVARHKQTSISFGVGAWAGGQRGAQRLDAGPRLEIMSTNIPLRLSADWRFRLAGDVRPDNGPAITLSTAF